MSVLSFENNTTSHCDWSTAATAKLHRSKRSLLAGVQRYVVKINQKNMGYIELENTIPDFHERITSKDPSLGFFFDSSSLRERICLLLASTLNFHMGSPSSVLTRCSSTSDWKSSYSFLYRLYTVPFLLFSTGLWSKSVCVCVDVSQCIKHPHPHTSLYFMPPVIHAHCSLTKNCHMLTMFGRP